MAKQSVQMQHDIGECVDAFYHGGKKLARLTFRAICEARQLKQWEAIVLGDKVRAELIRHGYLQTV